MPSDDDSTTNRGARAASGRPRTGRAFLAGRPVERIGFGAMQLPGRGVWGPPADRGAALTVLRQAMDLGVNHIDTAQFYGDGIANELIRSALHPYPDDLVLVSKVGSERDARGGWIPAQRPEQLRAGVEANLRTLGVDRLDVVNLRLMDDRSTGGAPGRQRVDLDDQLAEMVALRDEGLIGGIGLSNTGTDELSRALPVGIACVQNAFSVLDRSAAPVLALCREHDVPWVPFFPLGSAFPNRPKVTDHPVVVEVAARVEATPAQVGLAWLLAHHENTLLIPGTSNAQHLRENVASGEVRLDADARAALDVLGEGPGPVR